MAETLRRLVNIGTFTTLQEKLENWLNLYYVSRCLGRKLVFNLVYLVLYH